MFSVPVLKPDGLSRDPVHETPFVKHTSKELTKDGLSRDPVHETPLVKHTSEDLTKEYDFEETTVKANSEAVNEESDEEEEMVSKNSEVARKEDNSEDALLAKYSEEMKNKDDSVKETEINDLEKASVQITPMCKIQQIETEKRRKSLSELPPTDLTDSQRKEETSTFPDASIHLKKDRLFFKSDKYLRKCVKSTQSGYKIGLAPSATITSGHYDQPPEEISLKSEENIDVKDAYNDGSVSSIR